MTAVKSLFCVVLLAAAVQAQAMALFADVRWNEPVSPVTGNTLEPATFVLSAALWQWPIIYPHGFTDFTNYGQGQEWMIWNDLDAIFVMAEPWVILTQVATFSARDPFTGEMWFVRSALQFNPPDFGPATGWATIRIRWQVR